MDTEKDRYRAIVSSDWSECLSPSGPFDFIAFSFPRLEPELNEVFRGYTGNWITLGEAGRRIEALLPGPVTEEMMDAYLEQGFAVYSGVGELIEWCRGHGILFMLNTTGMIGYFQRVFAKGLLPKIPVLSANPLLRFPVLPKDPPQVFDLLETPDKGRNTEAVAARWRIPADKVVVMGDSGGDGPHFEWAHKAGAFKIASMAKHSLQSFCAAKGIAVDRFFGLVYGEGEERCLQKEMGVDFRELIPVLEKTLFSEAAAS